MRADVQPILAVDDDALARRDPLGHDRGVIVDRHRLDAALLDRIVRLHHPGIEPVRAVLDRDRRDGDRILARLDQEADAHEFARPQPLILVVEFSLELDRRGRLIDLVVDQQQAALRQLLFVVLVEGDDRHRALQHGFAHRAEIVLRQGEDDGAGLDLRQHRERIGVVGVDDVAEIDLAEADDAIDRRVDGGEVELGLRRFDRGLIGIDHGLGLVDLGLLLIDVLLGLVIALHQLLESRQILLRVDQLRLILALLRYRLIEIGLERRRIDLGQHVALMNFLTLAKIDGGDLAVDLGADRDRVQRIHGAERIIVNRHVLQRGRGHGDRDRRRRGIGRCLCAAVTVEAERDDCRQDHNARARENRAPRTLPCDDLAHCPAAFRCPLVNCSAVNSIPVFSRFRRTAQARAKPPERHNMPNLRSNSSRYTAQ